MIEKTWTPIGTDPASWGVEPIADDRMRLMTRALAVQKSRPDLLIDGRTAVHPAFDDWSSHQDPRGPGVLWDGSALTVVH